MSKRNLDLIHQVVWEAAVKAGRAAGDKCRPTPMMVTQHANVLNDNSPAVKTWRVDSGVCGFAWVVIKPGTSSFARWLIKHKLAGKHYYGGVSIWVSEYGQSMERKIAYARAMSEYLNKVGIRAYPGDRMD